MIFSEHTYSDYSTPDPPHQGLYLHKVVRILSDAEIRGPILDAGCGDGNFTHSLSEVGFQMCGIDLSDGGITRATQQYPSCRFAKWSVYDDYRRAFVGLATFDAVIAIEVIEHLYSPKTFVRRVGEALVPGGLVIVTSPYWGYLKNVALAVTNRLDRNLTALWEGGHIKHWSYRTLRMLFEEQGFEFLYFKGAGRPIPYLWNGMIMAFRNKG